MDILEEALSLLGNFGGNVPNARGSIRIHEWVIVGDTNEGKEVYQCQGCFKTLTGRPGGLYALSLDTSECVPE